MSRHHDDDRDEGQPIQLDLTKTVKALRLHLEKNNATMFQNSLEVALLLDKSPSNEHEWEEGNMQRLVQRMSALSILDVNGQLDLVPFSSECAHVGTLPLNPTDAQINEIMDSAPNLGGGTVYSLPVKFCLQHFGWLQPDAVHEQKSRFWQKINPWSKPAMPAQVIQPVAPLQRKTCLAVMGTDGECNQQDFETTEDYLRAAEERGDRVYFVFIGACEHGVEFKFIKQIAKDFENTGVVVPGSLEDYLNYTDEQFVASIVQPELIAWLKR